MKKIKLTQNKYALVDNSDFDFLNQYKWYYSNIGYATRTEYIGGIKGDIHNTRKVTIHYMHHEILGKSKKGFVIDHINRNKLDNQRKNLRFATYGQNQANQGLQKNNKSGYKGVLWIKERKKWLARIKFNRKSIFIGYFLNIKDAVTAYNTKAKELFKGYTFN